MLTSLDSSPWHKGKFNQALMIGINCTVELEAFTSLTRDSHSETGQHENPAHCEMAPLLSLMYTLLL